MFPACLVGAIGPAVPLFYKCARRIGRFGETDCPIFIQDFVPVLLNRERKIGIFSQCIGGEESQLFDDAAAPGANGSRHYNNAIEKREGALVEVLARDVLERLPAREQIDT